MDVPFPSRADWRGVVGRGHGHGADDAYANAPPRTPAHLQEPARGSPRARVDSRGTITGVGPSATPTSAAGGGEVGSAHRQDGTPGTQDSPRGGLGARRRAPVPLELGNGRPSERSHRSEEGSSAHDEGGYASADLRGVQDDRWASGVGWHRRVVTEPAGLHPSPMVQSPSTAASAYSSHQQPADAPHLSPLAARRVSRGEWPVGGGSTSTASDRSSGGSSLALPPIPDSLARAEREMVEEEARMSLDSYYLRPSPTVNTFGLPDLSNLRITTPTRYPSTAQPSSSSHFRSPSTPGPIDPHAIDRRGLIGVGELATPRWTTGQGHARRATTQMPPSESYDSITGISTRLRDADQPGLPLGSGQRLTTSVSQPASSMDKRTSYQPPKSAGWTEHKSREEMPALPRLPSIPNLGEFSPFKALPAEFRAEGSGAGGSSTPASPKSASTTSSGDATRARHRATSSSHTSSRRYSPKVQADLLALKEKEAARQSQQPGSPLSQASFKQPSSAGSSEMLASDSSRSFHAVNESDRRARKRSGGSVASDDRTEVAGPTHRDRADERDSRKTPPSAGRRSLKQSGDSPLAATMPANAHSIIRQFSSTRDFRDLPPSPSSASINKLLKESSSMQSFANRDGAHTTPTTSSPLSPAGGLGSTAARFNRGTYSALDRETEEAIRKLDGLGKTGLRKADDDGTLARRIRKAASSSSVGHSGGGSASTPPPHPTNNSPTARKDHRRSMFAKAERERSSPHASAEPSSEDESRAKRASSSTSAGTGTFSESAASTAPTSGSSVSQAGSKMQSTRRISAGSEAFLSDSDVEATSGLPIPPVPPLPKDFQSFGKPASLPRSNSSIYGSSQPNAAAYVPIKDGTEKGKTLSPLIIGDGRMPSSASSPALSGFDDLASVPASASATQLFDTTEKPRRMSKKWSFSSALGLNSFAGLHARDKSSATSPNTEALNPLDESALSPTSPELGTSLESAGRRLMDDRYSAASGRPVDLATARTISSTSNASTIQRPQQGSTSTAKLATASTASNRRMTPSSIPFFRRTSSSSVSTNPGADASAGRTDAKTELTAAKVQSGSLTSRKSVLGMGIPSLLKGSSSKRNLAAASQRSAGEQGEQSLRANEDGTMGEPKGSSSWGSRKRGKTFSISGGSAAEVPLSPRDIQDDPFGRADPAQQPQARETATEQKAASSTLTRSATHGTLLEGRSSLATIAGSPGNNTGPPSTPAHAVSNGAPGQTRSSMAATPTRIPRIMSRTNMGSPGLAGSMGPPKQPYAYSSSVRTTASSTATASTLAAKAASATPRRTNMAPPSTEFGMLDGPRGQTASRATARDAAAELPRAEDSPSLLAPVTSSGQGNLRKVSAPVSSSKRSLPVPPAPSAANSLTVNGRSQSRDLPAPPGNRRISLASTATANDHAVTSAKSSLSNRATLQAGSRLAGSSSQPFLSSVRPSSLRQSIVSRSASPLDIVDEDELRGDEEMASFYRRQKAKRTAKDTAADEIDHLMQFPETGAPLPEMTPHAFVQAKFDCLSLYERHEIVGFQSIYYSGTKSQKNAATREVTQNNHGYDDDRGDYLIIPGDHLAYRYEIEGVLGKGSFGQVLQCRDHKTGLCVAIKIIRNKKRFHQQALVEVKILEKLIEWDPQDVHHLIKITDNFYFRGHLCIVTELLSINLYELIKANSFVGFSSTLIRRFTRQMLASLDIMRQKRVIHCDLKPENILLCHPGRSKIKVIDFGSSCFEHEKVYTYIQSRFYRSPEIILGSSYHMAIDMWSLGCILAELYTGFPIFPGEDEKEQLSCIMEVLGVPDRGLVERSSRKKLFFDTNGSPRPFVNSKGKRRRPGTKTIAQVLKSDDDQFVDFIAKCLVWDPERRLKPSTAMQHPWIRAAKRTRVSSPAPGRLGVGAGGTSVAASPAGRNRSLQPEQLKGRISGPSPLVARNSIAASGASENQAYGSTSRLYKTSRGVAA